MRPVANSRSSKPSAPAPLYTMEVRLTDGPVEEAFWKANPDIVRTIQVRGDQTLNHLHLAIFKAFDRVEEHLYEFEVGGDGPDDPKARRYEIFDPDEDDAAGGPREDASATRLDALGLKVGDIFFYWFDFGDDWRHEIAVTAITPAAPKGRYPKVVGRVGASPPQDSIWNEDEDEDGAEIIPLPSARAGASGKSPLQALGPLLDRRAMERHTMAIQQMLDSDEYGSLEEAERAINAKLNRGDQLVWEPRTPVERAQARMYDAFAAKGKRRIKLAREALAISPDCADAYVLLAEEESKTVEEGLALCEEGVRAGRRALGERYFEEEAGSFWGLIETRSYMRALGGLADILKAAGRTAEAIAHWREMLRLNPNDNQGVRDPLLNALMEQGDDTGARLLMKQYEKDHSANWAWSRFLLTFRTQGAGRKADVAFEKAMEINHHVPQYLMGFKRLPKHPPELYGPGSWEEAAIYIVEAGEVWLRNKEVLGFLVDKVAKLLSEGPNSPFDE